MTAVGVAEAAEKQFEKLQEQLPHVLWAGLLSEGLQILMHLVHFVPERRQHHQPLCHFLHHSIASVNALVALQCTMLTLLVVLVAT